MELERQMWARLYRGWQAVKAVFLNSESTGKPLSGIRDVEGG